MTHPRPGHLLVVVVVLTALLAPHVVWSQETDDTEITQTPSELYRDVEFLRVIAELELTPNQARKIIPIVQQVATQIAGDAAADEAAYADLAESADVVINALLAAQEPPAADLRKVDQAASERTERERFRATLVGQAAASIQRTLTAEQAARIEPAAVQMQRRRMQARLEGAPTPVDYIVMKLDAQRELMPDEYLRTREARALEMAGALLGPQSPQVRDLAGDLLRLMNTVASWDAQTWADNRPTLPGQIHDLTGFPDSGFTHPIKHEQFLAWITSDRAVANLETWVITQAVEAASPFAGEGDQQ